MHVIIVGCGMLGSMLARRLTEAGEDVTVVDYNPAAFRRLGDDFQGQTVTGTGIDADVLARAGANDCGLFITTTGSDGTNLMAAQVAKLQFGIKNVLVRIYEPAKAEVFAGEGFSLICTTSLAVDAFSAAIARAKGASECT